jgi:hypothetical protein
MMIRIAFSALRALSLCLLAPIVGFAGALAATGGNDSPLNVPIVLLVATMFLSTLAGAATLSIQVMGELKANAKAGEPARPLLHPALYCLSHMLGSWCAGALAFLVAMERQAGVWWLLASVLVCSWIGAALLERVAKSWAMKGKP